MAIVRKKTDAVRGQNISMSIVIVYWGPSLVRPRDAADTDPRFVIGWIGQDGRTCIMPAACVDESVGTPSPRIIADTSTDMFAVLYDT